MVPRIEHVHRGPGRRARRRRFHRQRRRPRRALAPETVCDRRLRQGIPGAFAASRATRARDRPVPRAAGGSAEVRSPAAPAIGDADAVALLAYSRRRAGTSPAATSARSTSPGPAAVGGIAAESGRRARLHQLGRRLRSLARRAGDRADDAATADPLRGGEARGGAAARQRGGPPAIVILRLSTVFGPGEDGPRAIPSFINAFLRREEPVVHGDGTDVKDYIHVDDVAAAIVSACLRPRRRCRSTSAPESAEAREEVLDAVAAAMGVEARARPSRAERAPTRGLIVDTARARLASSASIRAGTSARRWARRRMVGSETRGTARSAHEPGRDRAGGFPVARIPAAEGGVARMLLENNPYPQDVRVRNEAESLAAAGHEVTVLAPRSAGQPAVASG